MNRMEMETRIAAEQFLREGKIYVAPSDYGDSFRATQDPDFSLITNGADTCVIIVFYKKGNIGLGHFYATADGELIGGSKTPPPDIRKIDFEMINGEGQVRFAIFSKDLTKKGIRNLVNEFQDHGFEYDEKNSRYGKGVHTLEVRMQRGRMVILWSSLTRTAEDMLEAVGMSDEEMVRIFLTEGDDALTERFDGLSIGAQKEKTILIPI